MKFFIFSFTEKLGIFEQNTPKNYQICFLVNFERTKRPCSEYFAKYGFVLIHAVRLAKKPIWNAKERRIPQNVNMAIFIDVKISKCW